jgi:hypothetical protein
MKINNQFQYLSPLSIKPQTLMYDNNPQLSTEKYYFCVQQLTQE